MCAALTGGSHQVPKAGRASTESRGTHLHRFVVVTTPCCCEEQRSLPLFSRVVSSYHEKGNHQKKKKKIKEYKRKKKGTKSPIVWLNNILDPWSMPSLLTTTKASWRHGDTLLVWKKIAMSGRKSWTLLFRGESSPTSWVNSPRPCCLLSTLRSGLEE